MAILPARVSGLTKFSPRSALAGWARCIKPATRALIASSRSRFCPHISPDHAELRERFEREAQTIAGLNHPHICTLYDVGHQDGTDFLVMEYIEGETLAQRVKGPLPLDQVMRYAIEIADALDKAHRKGITHRDLKPGNIMLTKSGSKLLDFGLAKLRQEAAPTTPESQVVTMKGGVTGARNDSRHAAVHGAGATRRKGSRRADGYLRIRRGGVRNGDGEESVRRQEACQPNFADHVDRSSANDHTQPMSPPALDRASKRCLAKTRQALANSQRPARGVAVDCRRRMAGCGVWW